MSIGIIGLGRLGSALVRGLCRECRTDIIYGFNRSPEKGLILEKNFADFKACDSADKVFRKCDTVFIWTKPQDAVNIMKENADLIGRRQHVLISSTLNVPLAGYTNKWAECFPNVNMPVGKGVTIIHYSRTLSGTDKKSINDILGSLGSVYEVSAEDMPYYSVLCSCEPALYSAMMEMTADIMSSHKGCDKDVCRRIVRETMSGTILLMESDNIDASEVIDRVAHPGGVSEAGVIYLKKNFPLFYENMLKAMKRW